jgi:tetratricopeptide (TPR) repeat protein
MVARLESVGASMWRGWIIVVVLSVVSTSVGHAQATASSDDELARNLFQAGKTAYESGNYEDALRYFEDAHARSHRPQLLYNIAQAADRLRNDQKALTAFKAYLAALPDAENREEVENRIRALERTHNPYGAVTTVPTPTETARAAVPTESMASAAAVSDTEPLTNKWWFWTAIGGGVVIGVIAAIALSSSDTQQGPIEANTGVTVMTLAGAP